MVRMYNLKVNIIALAMLILSGVAHPSMAQQSTTQSNITVDIEKYAVEGIDLEEASTFKTNFLKAQKTSSKEEEYMRNAPFKEIKNLYVPATYQNLNLLYWRTGMLDVENTADIDAYLLLLQCRKVKDIYKNEIQWSKLRSATKEYLLSKKGSFGRFFKVVQPLKLESYDFDNEGFTIDDKYDYKNMKRFRISNNSLRGDAFCIDRLRMFRDGTTTQEYVTKAPNNAVVSTRIPYSLKTLPMSETISAMYLDYIKQENLPKVAYIVFYVSLTDNIDVLKDEQGSPGSMLSDFSGKIDYVAVYADKELTRPLYLKDMRQSNQ